MRTFSIREADNIYECCEKQAVTFFSVNDEGSKQFAMCLRSIERSLGDLKEEKYWVDLLRPFKSYRFRIASLPVPLNSAFCIPDNFWQTIDDIVPKCKFAYPSFSEAITELANYATALAKRDDAPLLDALKQEMSPSSGDEKRAILTRIIPDNNLRKGLQL